MSQQAAVYRNNHFHHYIKLAEARENTGLRAREDGGYDEIHLQRPVGGDGQWDGHLGTGNAMPFSRVQNKMLKPKSINYPIPACGDHRLRWIASFMVSESRKAEAY